jgi:hypothetical protein
LLGYLLHSAHIIYHRIDASGIAGVFKIEVSLNFLDLQKKMLPQNLNLMEHEESVER